MGQWVNKCGKLNYLNRRNESDLKSRLLNPKLTDLIMNKSKVKSWRTEPVNVAKFWEDL